ncbi:MAG TPA: iron uptake transporter permease EfeU [Jatrophihabitantaceae bacterium]|nr:iron uptake transporter permease EfeU [Jatrophihabitantaceae bacterium]
MLPTFVIGLREGLEAALIVGIIAAFLRKQGRRDLVRWVFVGVGAAVLLCLAVGIALDVLSKNLPQREQEGLETVIGALAVGMVTYMVVWMKRHSRELKGQLEQLAAGALGGASKAGRAMIVMAFLAVLREGFETVVFLLAAFNESGSGSSAAIGALLGIAVAVGLGYGIYRGGVRLNLSKFFRATGLVLVLVAAGLVVNALHTAHEAGWLDAGQSGTVDLTWLVRPGSVQASLLTGMLGIQQHPVLIEVVGWLAYLIPVGVFVAWPPGRAVPRRLLAGALAGGGAALAAVTAVLALVAPSAPGTPAATSAGRISAQVISRSGDVAVLRTPKQSPAADAALPAPSDLTVRRAGSNLRGGVNADVYTASFTGSAAAQQPAGLTVDKIAASNGGRLPIGLNARPGQTLPARYTDRDELTVWIEPITGRVLDLRWTERVSASVTGSGGTVVPLSRPVAGAASALPVSVVRSAAAQARSALHNLDQRDALITAAWLCGVLAGLFLLAAAGLGAGGVARTRRAADVTTPELSHSTS